MLLVLRGGRSMVPAHRRRTSAPRSRRDPQVAFRGVPPALLGASPALCRQCAPVPLGEGIKTTTLVHWSTNSPGFLAAWLVINH